MPEDPNTLFEEAKCFRCNSDASLSDLLKLALLQRIADAGGGGGGGTPGGAANSVQFNDAGAFGGFGSFNSGTSVLTIPGDLLFNTDNADDIGASGASRPRTGYFGTNVETPFLDVFSGAIAASSPAIEVAQTWNNAGVTFVGFDVNITNTASAAASKIADWRVGGTSVASVKRSGIFGNSAAGSNAAVRSVVGFLDSILWDESAFAGLRASQLNIVSTTGVIASFLIGEGAAVLAQQNGVTAQTFRVYRTFTNSSNYERLTLQSAANEMIVAAETAGTGGDNIDLGLTAAGTGRVKINTALNTAVDGGLTAAFTANMVGSTGGPTTAAQNGWLLLKDSAGANIWVPVWK